MMESIKGVIEDYGDSVGVPMTTIVRTFPSLDTIISDMKTYSPALVFGSVMNISSYDGFFNHAVVAYDCASDSSYITVHYGWSGRNSINLVYQAIGQSLCITSFGSSPITFTDIPSSNWAYEAAAYCKRYGVIDNGTSAFEPNNNMTRGCFVNALYMLAGAPRLADYTDLQNKGDEMHTQFSDFSASSAFHDAAVWAHYYGILNGSSDTTLNLGGTLTRQEAVTFLYRFFNITLTHQVSGATGTPAEDYPDYSSVATWAKDAMDWATVYGLINGSDGYLLPNNTLIRSHSAQMCYKYTNKVTKVN